MAPTPLKGLFSRVSKERFLETYNKYPPNKWTEFVYRYFSKDVELENKWLSQSFIIVESILFVLGCLGTIFNASFLFIASVTIIFSGLLFSLGIVTLPAFIMNNLRIKKICKELNITIFEYNLLVDWYLV